MKSETDLCFLCKYSGEKRILIDSTTLSNSKLVAAVVNILILYGWIK